MINKGLMTSNSSEWETPQWLFDELNKEFNFILDVCATKNNKKCEDFYNIKMNGLLEKWSTFKGCKYMNPPYGREIKDWVKKASEERQVVALLPARTDTKYFHKYIYKKRKVEIRFLKGRLKFSNSKNSAPFPSMIVIFK